MRFSRADQSLLTDWWFTIDRRLLAALMTLMGAGFLMSLAASPSVAVRRGLDPYHFVGRHGVFLLAAAGIMLAVALLRPPAIMRLGLALLVVTLPMLVLVLWAGPEINGAQRWLAVGGLQLQPSELMKPAFVIVSALLLSGAAGNTSVPAFPAAIGLVLLCVVLLALEPDIGQAILLAATWAGIAFLSGRPLRTLAAIGVLGAGGLLAAYASLDHVRLRVDRFLFPGKGETFQLDRARQSFIEGGFFGRGPGEGTIKTVLPDAHTDFIAAVLAEEFGVIACVVLLGLFAFVVLRGVRHALDEPQPFRRLAIAGLALMFAGQTLINLGVNVGLLPAKGMTLPFVSYGGSSLLGTAIAMGALLALCRRTPRALRLKNTIMLGMEQDRGTGHFGEARRWP